MKRSVTAIRKTLRSSGDDVNADTGTTRTQRPPAGSLTTLDATNPVLQPSWSSGGVGTGADGGTPGGTPGGSASNLASSRGITVHPESRRKPAAQQATAKDRKPMACRGAAEIKEISFALFFILSMFVHSRLEIWHPRQ